MFETLSCSEADSDPSEFEGYVLTKEELQLDEAFEPHGAFLRSFAQ